MRLLDLNPEFYRRDDDTHFQTVETLAEADGICFQCPKCWEACTQYGEPLDYKGEPNEYAGQKIGVHYVICWSPRVPQTTHPVPGRWEMLGTSLADLTLKAGSSSILLTGEGCKAHFFIEDGAIRMA